MTIYDLVSYPLYIFLFACKLSATALPNFSNEHRNNVSDIDSVYYHIKHITDFAHSDTSMAMYHYRRALTFASSSEDMAGLARAHYTAGDFLLEKGYYRAAKEKFHDLARTSSQKAYKKGLSCAYAGYGKFFEKTSQYILSKKYYAQALDLLDELAEEEPLLKANIYFGFANVFSRTGEYKKADSFYFKALRLYKQSDDKANIAATLRQIGFLFSILGKTEKSLEYYRDALALSLQSGDDKEIAFVWNVLADGFVNLDQFDSAELYINQSLEILEKYKIRPDLAHAYENLGIIKAHTYAPEKSLAYFKQSLAIHEALGQKYAHAKVLYLKARLYQSHNDIENARRDFISSLKLAQEVGYLWVIRNASAHLALIEAQGKDSEEIYQYFSTYLEANDSLRHLEAEAAKVELEYAYQLEQARDSIEAFSRQEIHTLDEIIQTQRNWQLITLIGLITLLFFVAVIYRNFQLKKMSNLLLVEQRDQVFRQKRALESLDSSKSRFFANISHELRTPLTLISGPLESLASREKNNISKSSKREINLILKNTQKLRVLVDDILDLSKLDSGKIKAKKNPVEVRPYLTQIENNYQTLAAHVKIECQFDLADLPDDYLMLDAEKLIRIINNLLSNAIKYAPENSKVALKALKQKDRLVVRVIDQGQGIPAKDKPFIFDRYFQSNQPNTPIQGGTGLGLNLAKEYARLMGGDLILESSEEGKGSTFLLSLPYQVADAALIEDKLVIKEDLMGVEEYQFAPDQDKRVIRKANILLAEDDLQMQEFIENILEEHHRVTAVSSGRQALDALKHGDYDLVLADVTIHAMDGFVFLEELRKSPTHGDLPVIILTALNDDLHKTKGLSLGVDDYIIKPFYKAEMLARINNLLWRREEKYKANNLTVKEKSYLKLSYDPQFERDLAFIKKLEQLIIKNLKNEITETKGLAVAFKMSQQELSRKVKMTTGLTIKEFHQEFALQRARQLLETHDYSNISVVSNDVGIKNTTSFVKAYTKRFGIDPRRLLEEPV